MSARESIRQKHNPLRAPLHRCPRCALHLGLCLCACMEPIAVATRVVVYRHRIEVHKPTNTGRLVPIALVQGEIRTFGGQDEVLDTSNLLEPPHRPLLLFPSARSVPLTCAEVGTGPYTLLVPDSDWRRAFKLATREPLLAHVPRVHLPSGPPSMYRLRRHPDPRFLATFESVARALGILEGPEIQARLEHLFRIQVDRLLWSRGQLPAESITGGLPVGPDDGKQDAAVRVRPST